MKNLVLLLIVTLITLNANAQEELLNKNATYLHDNFTEQFEETLGELVHAKLKDNRKAQKNEKFYVKMMTAELNAQSDALFEVKDTIYRIIHSGDTSSIAVIISLLKEFGSVDDWFFDEDELPDEEWKEREAFENKHIDADLTDFYIEDHLRGIIFAASLGMSEKYYLEPLIRINCDWALLLEKYEEEG